MNDEEASYFDISKEKEKIWCKIGEAGQLEFVDWDIVKDLAHKFDVVEAENRNEQMLIAKLMWLVKEEFSSKP